MSIALDDSIAALASPAGAAERGIVRVSGSRIADAIRSVFKSADSACDWEGCRRPHRFSGRVHIPAIGVALPVSLMYWPTARSFTGQPMAEFHTIGSPPLLDALLEELCRHDVRLARRGEFTMRAFLAGRIDLLQAEAVLGVIEATDHQELQQALHQLGGGITARLADIRTDLIAILGDLEAGLDFVEEDIEFITKSEIVRRLDNCLTTLSQLTTDAHKRLPSGWKRRVVLAGLPNAGKSTLFNRLSKSSKAIVSSIPGTTRDYLMSSISLSGPGGDIEIELIDTAGYEEAENLIMNLAQQLRGQQTDSGDLIVWCRSVLLSHNLQWEDDQLRESFVARGLAVLPVITQIDRSIAVNAAQATDRPRNTVNPLDTDEWQRISAETSQGIEDLRLLITERLLTDRSARGELLSSTTVRCRDSLHRCTEALNSARHAADVGAGDELIALDLRQALHELSIILGEVYTDDILDHIFSNFCIGK